MLLGINASSLLAVHPNHFFPLACVASILPVGSIAPQLSPLNSCFFEVKQIVALALVETSAAVIHGCLPAFQQPQEDQLTELEENEETKAPGPHRVPPGIAPISLS